MVSLLFFLFGLAALWASWKMLGDFFSPPAIFVFFWCLALGLFFMNLVEYDPIKMSTWVALLIGAGSFLVGCFFPMSGLFLRPSQLQRPPRFHLFDPRRFERGLLILFTLGVLGFGVQLYHLQTQIGIQNFLTNPQAVREVHSNVKYLGFFNILNLSNFCVGVLYISLYKRPRKWVYFMLAWALVTTFLSTDRTRFFYAIIWTFYSVAYLQHRVRLKMRTILMGAGTVVALGCFFLLVALVYKKQAYENNQVYINIPPQLGFLADPYIYMTGSFPVLDAFIDEQEQLELVGGKHTLEPFVKIIEFLEPDFQRAPLVSKFYSVPLELNVGTFLQPIFADFGWPGLAVVPFLIGWITCWIYVRMRVHKTLFLVYASGIVAFCTTISIFVNHFIQTATWFFVIVGLGLFSYSRGQKEADRDVFRPGIYPEPENGEAEPNG